jgi:hypothetical protein
MYVQGRRACQYETDILARLADAATENLTLATTRYLMAMLKGGLKERLMGKGKRSSPAGDAARGFYNTGIVRPAGGLFERTPLHSGVKPHGLHI